ncbi:MAG: sporulation protein YunB [Clostridia bacterium]|nr:sporulation protein YunB [Clostridia bacterium]
MQYQHKKNYKIYSRPRLNLVVFKNSPKSHKSRRKLKKTMPFALVIFIAIITCFSVWNFIDPIFETLCEDKAKAVATLITNEETTNIMKKYNYDTFFTIEKDEKGNVQMINANVLKINEVTSDIAINIQNRLDESLKNTVYISSGAITGVRFLSGFGPRITLRISSSGIVDTDLRSEFISQGVNQTMHRVYLDIKTNVNILTSFKTIQKTIENQVLIAENVIVGDIPNTYYNFEGTNGEDEALRLIE